MTRQTRHATAAQHRPCPTGQSACAAAGYPACRAERNRERNGGCHKGQPAPHWRRLPIPHPRSRMKLKSLALAASAITLWSALPAHAADRDPVVALDDRPLGEWVNDLAKQFNESQKDLQGRAHLQGQLHREFTAAIAAFRAGNAPHILQVFEVGTATMMASKGAIVPVAKVMKDAGVQVRPRGLRAGRGRLLHGAQRPDAELPVQQLDDRLLLNKDAFKAAGIDTEAAAQDLARTWPLAPPSSRPAATSARSPTPGRAGPSWRASPPGTTSSSRPSATASAAGHAAGHHAAACAPHREPGQHGQAGPVHLQGPRGNGPRPCSCRVSAR
jgi:hypothetical protein